MEHQGRRSQAGVSDLLSSVLAVVAASFAISECEKAFLCVQMAVGAERTTVRVQRYGLKAGALSSYRARRAQHTRGGVPKLG